MEESGSAHQFFPLFVFIVICIFSFLRKRKKREEAQVPLKMMSPLPPKQKREPPPSLPIATIRVSSPPSEPTPAPSTRSKPRIVKIVNALPSKKQLILISELLKK